ncbi:bifunctional diguanylate cyclase/phosphodiesterase [Marinobacter zhanjiangensis]|uniref:GGDEF domain-containing protein n=1 Tax=Marinobacter zhanjiangensis TaxID=578215 RepID=A0ABQ3B4Q6_9GAMM|nr:EAL domain-containing protein [Marinobacter zhanjiangensis]GGY73743.1 GGDEF domain-containing protein [Marinobacter zhanjiangensis]
MQQANRKIRSSRVITLRTLLLFFTGALVLLLLVVSMVISARSFHGYVIEELEGQTRDAATAIGLSLSNAIDATDTVAVSSLIDSIFDSSQYLVVEFVDHDNNVVAGRSQPLADLGVPRWFIRAADLPRPEGTAAVMRGWQWLGQVRVVGHPGNAYRDLWRVSQWLILSSVLIGAIAIASLYFLLGRLLRPLRAVERQAEAIGHRDFRKRTHIRSTRELNQVTRAMNQMTDDLEQLFAGQAALIAHLRRLNNEDALTGLASRNAFDQRLAVEAVTEEGRRPGSLVLVQVSRFADVNQHAGRLEADALLTRLAECVHQFVDYHAGSFAGRRSGAEFAVFIPGGAPADALIWGRELVEDLQAICVEFAGERSDAQLDLLVHGGVAGTGDGVSVKTLFESADTALARAQTEGVHHCELADSGADVHHGAEDWRRLLTDALDREALWLWEQPVIATDDETVLYRQVFSRLLVEREWVRGNAFTPMAERFGLIGRLDVLVFQRALQRLREEPSVVAGLSLGISTVMLPDIPERILLMLRAAGTDARRLWIGIPEQALHYHRQEAQAFIRQLRRTGASVLVDRFGVGGIPFSYLKNLSIQALRIDSSFVHGIDRHEENRFFLESMITIAHGRGVKVYAAGVETESEWRTLKAAGIDGATGYHLGRPGPAGDPPVIGAPG